jgi:hypothetical protein
MDAIKKKMVAMKMEKENALDRAEQLEQKLERDSDGMCQIGLSEGVLLTIGIPHVVRVFKRSDKITTIFGERRRRARYRRLFHGEK